MNDAERLDFVLNYVVNGPINNDSDFREKHELEIKKLIQFGFVVNNDPSGTPDYNVTRKGMMFYFNGGFKNHTAHRNRVVDNIESSTRLNKWYYKYKWLPITVSLIALIVSFFSLCSCESESKRSSRVAEDGYVYETFSPSSFHVDKKCKKLKSSCIM